MREKHANMAYSCCDTSTLPIPMHTTVEMIMNQSYPLMRPLASCCCVLPCLPFTLCMLNTRRSRSSPRWCIARCARSFVCVCFFLCASLPLLFSSPSDYADGADH